MSSFERSLRPRESARARQPLSLRQWLGLLGLLLALPMVAIEWTASRHAQEMLLVRARQDSLQLAETYAVGQEQFVAGVAQLLAAVAATPVSTQEGRPACGAFFRRLQHQQPWYADVGLLDPQGRTVCSAQGDDARPAQLAYYRRARDENVLTVGEYAAGPLSGKPVVTIGWPVRTDDGDFRAVAFASVDLAWLVGPMRAHRLPPGAQAFLTDAGGTVLAASASAAAKVGIPLPDLPLRRALLERRTGMLAESADGMLRALRPIQVGGRPSLYVAVSVPRDAVTAQAVHASHQRLLMLFAVALVLALLAWMIGDRWLGQPLRELLRNLRHAQHASYVPPQPMAGRRRMREFGALHRGVARLAQVLDAERRASQQTVQALRESESSYRALFESTPLPLWVMDHASQRFLAVNGAMALHYGYPVQSLLAMTLEDLQPPAWQASDGELPATRTHRKHNGERCQMQVSSQPMVFEGRPARLCMALDVTQTLAAQAQVREVHANLERLVTERARELALSNRELEAFSYSVSHDLRNPLQAIAMFSDLLAEHPGAQLDAQARVYLQRIQEGTRCMEALIEDLLALARVAQAELVLAPVDLSALAQEVVQELRTQNAGRSVQVSVAPGLRCVGDARLLRQALVNLLGNAWKFTAHAPAPHIELGLLEKPGEPACCYIADNGAGFDMAQAERLFEPFQRLHGDHEFPGSGVGLASVKRIVARHGGRIWASGAPGAGASFYLVLPGLVQQL